MILYDPKSLTVGIVPPGPKYTALHADFNSGRLERNAGDRVRGSIT
jgi:hypothetical protein